MTAWLRADHPLALARAAYVIQNGGLVIFPTDTVYGLAADLWQPPAVAAIYEAKGRPPERAIPILLASRNDMRRVSRDVPETAWRLANAFWPGPLTIAVPKQPRIPHIVSSLPTVGVRIPDDSRARAVIRACRGALAVTSANRSGDPNPLTAQEAAESLPGVDLVLDGGRCPGGVPSTVVDVSGGVLVIVREGPISEEDLQKVLRG